MAASDQRAVPRYLIANALMGAALGIVFGLGLLVTDTFGLRSLILASTDAATATVIFLVGGAMAFSPFVVATAIWSRS